MYAIVDIETTGGYAANNDITEIAIILHNGSEITGRFESLIRPKAPIPYYIQVLTGISHEMVGKAPPFEELAPKIFELLNNRIFIAHNVNFDFSFIKHHLSLAGFDLQCQKLCTVRLTKKVFPGLPSYSLGNICRQFEIEIQNRHRAGGDAAATSILFERILLNNGQIHINEALKKRSKEQCLPVNLPKASIDNLPFCAGVYYFHNEKGKVIYVGKAKNIKYRVCSHFTHNGPGRQRQEFMRNIYGVSYQETGSELMAFILESIEIKRLWPEYNSSQKRFTPNFALYDYEDRNGYIHLVIDKQKKGIKPLYTFNDQMEGNRLLRLLIKEYTLCPKMCFIERGSDPCTAVLDNTCYGACQQLESPLEYNKRVNQAIEHLDNLLPSFAVVDNAVSIKEQCCILMEKGRFYGMGYIPNEVGISDMEQLKTYLKAYPENDYIRSLVYQFVTKKPDKRIEFKTV